MDRDPATETKIDLCGEGYKTLNPKPQSMIVIVYVHKTQTGVLGRGSYEDATN